MARRSEEGGCEHDCVGRGRNPADEARRVDENYWRLVGLIRDVTKVPLFALLAGALLSISGVAVDAWCT
jgi:hypothetical protein